MRFWVIALCLLTLLPALSDGRGAAAGAKTEALIAAVSGDLFVVAEQPDAEPESENGDGILSPVDIPLPRFISFSNTEIVSHGVADYYSSNEIRGPPRFS